MLSFSAQVSLTISEEEMDFLQRILAIPFGEGSWKKLVMLNNLHVFCGGLVPMDEAGRLDTQTHLRKFSLAYPLPTFVCPLPIDSLVLTCWLVLLFQRYT